MSTFLEKGDVFDDGDLDNFNIGWDIISSTVHSSLDITNLDF